MLKTEAVKHVLGAAGTAPVIVTTGFACRMAQSAGPRPQNFYMLGSMGLAGAVGAGLASATGRPVVVLDGDGSLLMNASVLCAIAGAKNLSLVHVVLDDGQYASTGGQPTLSADHDFVALAAAAGYPTALAPSDGAELATAVAEAVSRPRGPILLHCRLTAGWEAPGPRIAGSLREHAESFRDTVLGARPAGTDGP